MSNRFCVYAVSLSTCALVACSEVNDLDNVDIETPDTSGDLTLESDALAEQTASADFQRVGLPSFEDWEGEAPVSIDANDHMVLVDEDAEAYQARQHTWRPEGRELRLTVSVSWQQPTAFGLIRVRTGYDGAWTGQDILLNPFDINIASGSSSVTIENQIAGNSNVQADIFVTLPTEAETVQVVLFPAVGHQNEVYQASPDATGAIEFERLSISSR